VTEVPSDPCRSVQASLEGIIGSDLCCMTLPPVTSSIIHFALLHQLTIYAADLYQLFLCCS